MTNAYILHTNIPYIFRYSIPYDQETEPQRQDGGDQRTTLLQEQEQPRQRRPLEQTQVRLNPRSNIKKKLSSFAIKNEQELTQLKE